MSAPTNADLAPIFQLLRDAQATSYVAGIVDLSYTHPLLLIRVIIIQLQP